MTAAVLTAPDSPVRRRGLLAALGLALTALGAAALFPLRSLLPSGPGRPGTGASRTPRGGRAYGWSTATGRPLRPDGRARRHDGRGLPRGPRRRRGRTRLRGAPRTGTLLPAARRWPPRRAGRLVAALHARRLPGPALPQGHRAGALPLPPVALRPAGGRPAGGRPGRAAAARPADRGRAGRLPRAPPATSPPRPAPASGAQP